MSSTDLSEDEMRNRYLLREKNLKIVIDIANKIISSIKEGSKIVILGRAPIVLGYCIESFSNLKNLGLSVKYMPFSTANSFKPFYYEQNDDSYLARNKDNLYNLTLYKKRFMVELEERSIDVESIIRDNKERGQQTVIVDRVVEMTGIAAFLYCLCEGLSEDKKSKLLESLCVRGVASPGNLVMKKTYAEKFCFNLKKDSDLTIEQFQESKIEVDGKLLTQIEQFQESKIEVDGKLLTQSEQEIQVLKMYAGAAIQAAVPYYCPDQWMEGEGPEVLIEGSLSGAIRDKLDEMIHKLYPREEISINSVEEISTKGNILVGKLHP